MERLVIPDEIAIRPENVVVTFLSRLSAVHYSQPSLHPMKAAL
jgi:hypothetical protein